MLKTKKQESGSPLLPSQHHVPFVRLLEHGGLSHKESCTLRGEETGRERHAVIWWTSKTDCEHVSVALTGGLSSDDCIWQKRSKVGQIEQTGCIRLHQPQFVSALLNFWKTWGMSEEGIVQHRHPSVLRWPKPTYLCSTKWTFSIFPWTLTDNPPAEQCTTTPTRVHLPSCLSVVPGSSRPSSVARSSC